MDNRTTKYLVTRQNTDGSFDEVGMNNRTIVSGYKTYRNAFRFGINPFGRGRVCRVEVYYGGNIQQNPHDRFHTCTYTNTRGA